MEKIITGKKEAYREVAENRKFFIEGKETREKAVDTELKYLVSEFRLKPIKNIEIKYKWFPAFSWNDEEGKPDYDHFHQKAALLHHKAAIINGETLVTGSYNWSNYAETKNLENIMVVSGPEDRKLVTDFAAEFEAIWDDPELSKSGDECREAKEKICGKIIRLKEAEGEAH
jgi:phosphatidylserine/phosphatidylglycerophosphate/cardiolipin synthase-like enzyme